MKATKIVVAAALFSFATAGSALAFHSGGVAECEGCHTMHNSYEGKAVTKEDGTTIPLAQFNTGAGYLLKATDQGSTCLNCHESTPGSYHISTPGVATHLGPNATNPVTQYTPGGDFTWLKLTYSYSAYNAAGSETSLGERHGHNVIAADYGYVQDGTQTASPGGSYPAGNLYCSSCHDPHGRFRRSADNQTFATSGNAIYASGSYGAVPKLVNGVTYAVGAYRILGGSGYSPDSLGGANAFVNNPPLAVAPSSYNAADTTFGGNVIVKYGTGMSEWCANCHGQMHSGGTATVHPANSTDAAAKLSNGYPFSVAQNYNAYLGSGNMTGTNAYSNLVPFETGDQTTALIKSNNPSTPVAGANSNVMCLSCHRAHASGFDSMLRFDASATEFQTTLDSNNNISYPGTDAVGASGAFGPKTAGRSVSDWQAAYNGRPASVFSGYQRVLCNKCHAKD